MLQRIDSAHGTKFVDTLKNKSRPDQCCDWLRAKLATYYNNPQVFQRFQQNDPGEALLLLFQNLPEMADFPAMFHQCDVYTCSRCNSSELKNDESKNVLEVQFDNSYNDLASLIEAPKDPQMSFCNNCQSQEQMTVKRKVISLDTQIMVVYVMFNSNADITNFSLAANAEIILDGKRFICVAVIERERGGSVNSSHYTTAILEDKIWKKSNDLHDPAVQRSPKRGVVYFLQEADSLAKEMSSCQTSQQPKTTATPATNIHLDEVNVQGLYIKRSKAFRKQFYPGVGVDPVVNNHKEARNFLLAADSFIHQYTNPLLCPELLSDEALVQLTAFDFTSLNLFMKDMNAEEKKSRVMTILARYVAYLEKLRLGPSFDTQGCQRNLCKEVLRENFWKLAVQQYLCDKSIMHRNYPILKDNHDVNEMLMSIQIDCPFWRAFFEEIVPADEPLVFLVWDHTYVYHGKFISPSIQRRSYHEPKTGNLQKILVGASYTGKAIYYSPPTAAIVPKNGDGNLTTLMLSYELDGSIPKRLDPILRPTDKSLHIFSFFDRGYEMYRFPETQLTLEKYFYNDQLDGHNPKSRYFTIHKQGEKVLGRDFILVDNPTPAAVNLQGSDDSSSESSSSDDADSPGPFRGTYP